MTEDLLGYSVSVLDAATCADEVMRGVRAGERGAWLACLNPHSYVIALKDGEFAGALRRANWLIPDGIGVVYASRVLGGTIRTRVTGWDVFAALHDRLARTGGGTVFLLGSTPQTLSAMKSRLSRECPQLQVVGTYSPPFKAIFSGEDNERMRAAVNACRPDVLWVGMTAPKQERWISENAPLLDAGFIGAIGAVFDFYVGNVHRSSAVFQKLGLEWLPRLLQEPKRLWRRTFVSAPVFVGHVARQCWVQRRRIRG